MQEIKFVFPQLPYRDLNTIFHIFGILFNLTGCACDVDQSASNWIYLVRSLPCSFSAQFDRAGCVIFFLVYSADEAQPDWNSSQCQGCILSFSLIWLYLVIALRFRILCRKISLLLTIEPPVAQWLERPARSWRVVFKSHLELRFFPSWYNFYF